MKTNLLSFFPKKWLSMAILFLLLPLFISAANIPSGIPSIALNQRQLCDLELIMNGGFAPLDTFMNRQDYEGVVNEMRLADGTLWPIPIVLDIQEKEFAKLKDTPQIALKDPEGFTLACLDVTEIWQPNKLLEAEKVYGTTDTYHPGVNYLLNRTGIYYMTGKLTKIQASLHFDFADLRRTPEELKKYFQDNGIKKIVAFQTRNPMHRAHLELTVQAANQLGAHLLIHPSVGLTKPGDVDHFTRVKCYKKLLTHYPENSTTLSLLSLAMRFAGPREALWHAIIRKNYGCTHFIVGRDHGGPGKDRSGSYYYKPYAAQDLVRTYADEIEIAMVPFKEVVFVEDDNNYQAIDEVALGKSILSISGTEFRRMLNEGSEIPAWFSFPDVVEELRKIYPPRLKQGFTLFFTGLSGSGKSTLAKAVAVKLAELQDRSVTILDGDVIRTHLSSELGFSKEHRSINIKRVGFVASEITKNGGVAICAMIAPYEVDRNYDRELISGGGNFIEIYVSTPFDVCSVRDTKGFYHLAKEGKMSGFTGLDDPYEIPQNAEITIDTTRYSVTEGVDIILNYLRQLHHISE